MILSSNVLLVSFPSGRNLAFSSSSAHFNLRFNFTPISQTRVFSSIDVVKEVDKNSSSSASEILVSKHVHIEEPSSVHTFFKTYGFSDARIQELIRRHPKVRNMKVEKNLKPKMEFFLSIGVKGEDLVAIMCRYPSLLSSSLNERIIPCYDFLKRILLDDELVVKSLKNSAWIWKRNLEKNVVPNLEFLKKVGVPKSNIQFFLVRASHLFCLNNANFSEMVNRAINMGFDPSKYSFIEAIWCWPTKSTWERKAKVCTSWGWSDSDISIALRKNPNFMHKSVEKLTAVMDFLVKKMGWDPSDVAVASYVFNHSLEKSIIPKCSVIRVLKLKGLIEEEIALSSFIPCDRKTFLDRFVFGYREQVPELLDIFEGKVDLEDTKLK